MVAQKARTKRFFQKNVQGKMFSVFYGSLQDKNLAQKNVQGTHRVGWDILPGVFCPSSGTKHFL